LHVRNPYAELPTPDRALAIALLPAPPEPINLALADAADRVRAALLADGTALVRGTAEVARTAVLCFAAEPIDTGPVLAYPRVRGATRAGGNVTVVLELAEVAQ
jgi:hypothetical protein